MKMPWRSWLVHPLGVGPLLGSLGLAAIAVLGGPGSGRELLLIAWGILAYASVVIVKAIAWRTGAAAPPGRIPAADASPPRAEAPGDLVRLTERALRDLNQLPRLENSSLRALLPRTLKATLTADRQVRPTPLDEARALREVLIAAIERLKVPAPDISAGDLLYEEYVLGQPNAQIMARHYVT